MGILKSQVLIYFMCNFNILNILSKFLIHLFKNFHLMFQDSHDTSCSSIRLQQAYNYKIIVI